MMMGLGKRFGTRPFVWGKYLGREEKGIRSMLQLEKRRELERFDSRRYTNANATAIAIAMAVMWLE